MIGEKAKLKILIDKIYFTVMFIISIGIIGNCAYIVTLDMTNKFIENELIDTQQKLQETKWENDIKTEEIVIPGLKRDYNLLFLTDCHIIAETDSLNNDQIQRKEMFTSPNGLSSAEQFDNWITYANSQQADSILLGGDIIDTPSEENLAFLKFQFERLQMPYTYTLGNHDWNDTYQDIEEEKRENRRLILQSYLNGNSAIQVNDCGEFLIVAVDNSNTQVSGEVLTLYQNALSLSKPTILLVHVPFLTQSVLIKAQKTWSTPVVIGGGNYGGIYPNDDTQKFIDLTTATDSPVVIVLAGHVHYFDRDYIDGDTKILQLVGDAGYKGCGTWIHLTNELSQF